MKNKIVFMMLAVCLGFAACSDENDEPNGGESNPVNPTTVFVNGIPKQVGSMTISTNNDGLVSHISDGNVNVDVSYPNLSRTMTSDVVIDIDDSEEQYTVNVSLNSIGYAKYWKMSWKDGDWEERWFEYNSDGQLQKIKFLIQKGMEQLNSFMLKEILRMSK
ncbi:MAG: hypothetical protein K2O88_03575 [Paramuribaculum sp.]|nr:hypothetical protein [Paramuribaculum sp.]